MTSKFGCIAILSAIGLMLAIGVFAQETGGVQIPERPAAYAVPPSNGGGGGRPGLRVGTGVDVQFGGPRDTFTLPESQILYRADDQFYFVEVPVDEGAAQVPPSNGGGGGRPGPIAEMEDEAAEEFGYDYYDPPDYIEDCAHPWHGECNRCSYCPGSLEDDAHRRWNGRWPRTPRLPTPRRRPFRMTRRPSTGFTQI